MSKAMKTMTQAAASRIQSAEAKNNGGVVEKGSFAARAQSSAAKNSGGSNSNGSGNSNPNWPSKNTGKPSGRGRGNNPPKNK